MSLKNNNRTDSKREVHKFQSQLETLLSLRIITYLHKCDIFIPNWGWSFIGLAAAKETSGLYLWYGCWVDSVYCLECKTWTDIKHSFPVWRVRRSFIQAVRGASRSSVARRRRFNCVAKSKFSPQMRKKTIQWNETLLKCYRVAGVSIDFLFPLYSSVSYFLSHVRRYITRHIM